MSRWWRAQDSAVDNPKLILLSDKQHRAWFNLCCVCSQNGGTLPAANVIAVKLRVTAAKARAIVAELAALRLIDIAGDGTAVMHDWSSWQYKTDNTDPTTAKRSKRYRDAKRDATVTDTVTVTVTPPCQSRLPETEADTEPEKISEPDGSAAGAADGFDDIPGFLQRTAVDAEPINEDSRAKLFRLGKTILVSFGVAERRTGALIGQWLKAQNDPDGLLAALQFARERNVAEPVAYVSALIHGKPANGAANGFDRRPGESLGQLCTRLAAEARKLEAAAGFGRSDDAVRSH